MKPLEARSRALLTSALEAESPPDGARARVRSRVMAKVACAGAAAAATTAVAKTGVAGTSAAKAATGAAVTAKLTAGGAVAGTAASGLAKAVLIGSLAGLVATSGAALLSSDPPRSPVTVPAAAASSARALPPGAHAQRAHGAAAEQVPAELETEMEDGNQAQVLAAPETEEGDRAAVSGGLEATGRPPAATAPERRQDEIAQTGSPAAQAAPSRALRGELGLLTEAQTAIGKGDTARALQLLEAHEARYPGGTLAEERLAARAIALCNAGRAGEARRALADFNANAGSSPLASRVQKACAAVVADGAHRK